MKDFQKDISYFIDTVYSSNKKFITVEINELTRQIHIFNKLRNALMTTESDIILYFDLSSKTFIESKNIEELLSVIKEELIKNHNTSNSKIYSMFYFTSEVSYASAYNIFSLLNLTREYLLDTFNSTIFILNSTYLNIFLFTAKDIFSWVQYNFNFLENNNKLKLLKFDIFKIKRNELKYIKQIEKKFQNGSNRLKNALLLSLYYIKLNNNDSIKYLEYIENKLHDKKIIAYLWTLYYCDYKKSYKYIDTLLSENENIFNIEYFDLDMFIYCLHKSNIPDNKLSILFSTIYLQDISNKKFYESIYLLMVGGDEYKILNNFYGYLEDTEINNDNQGKLLESLFYIIRIECKHANYEKIIHLYYKYNENFLCHDIVQHYPEMFGNLIFYVADAFRLKKELLKASSLYKKIIYIYLKNRNISSYIIKSYHRISFICYVNENYSSAKKYLDKTIIIMNNFNNHHISFDIISTYLETATGYLNLGLNNEAKTILKQSLVLLKQSNLIDNNNKKSILLGIFYIYNAVDSIEFVDVYFNDLVKLLKDIDNNNFTFNEISNKDSYVILLLVTINSYAHDKKSIKVLQFFKILKLFLINNKYEIYTNIDAILDNIRSLSTTLKHKNKIISVLDDISANRDKLKNITRHPFSN